MSALFFESKGNFDELIEKAAANTKRLLITKDSDIDLASLGFTVPEALAEYDRIKEIAK